MGGSSKSQTVGYKYYVGMHMILCHGPIDKLYSVKVDDKQAWAGSINGGSILINNVNLFGGETREGGVLGQLDFEPGGPTQGQNSYLAEKLGALVPNFRGMVGIVLRSMYMGLNPYLKNWSFKVSRIHLRQNGIAQWYDSKSQIPALASVTQEGYRGYLEHPNQTTAHLGWASGPIPAQGIQSDEFLGQVITNERNRLYLIEYGPSAQQMHMEHADYNPGNSSVYASGNDQFNSYPPGTYIAQLPGVNMVCPNGGTPTWNWGVDGVVGEGYVWCSATTSSTYDMNPAHIIRECLTDPYWGMGYQDSDIDDTSFQVAADTLFTESMGMSLLWESQSSIEDFIKLVVKHIDAALYVNTSTGKFTLKLIRNDYTVGSLITLNESNIDKLSDFTRVQFGELTTSVTVTYWDATTGKDATLTISDIALSQMQNCTINAAIQYPGFTNSSIASRVAQRDLKTLSTPLASCTIYANKDASSLTIGSVFKLTWPDYDLTDTVMRVTGIGYGDGKSNRIRLQCVEDVFATPSNAFIPYTPPAWTNPSQAPIAAIIRFPQESPYLELVQVLGQTTIDDQLVTDPNLGYLAISAGKPANEVNSRIFTDNGSGYVDRGSLDFSPSALLNGAIGQLDTTFPIDNGKNLTIVTIGTWAQIDTELVSIEALTTTSITVKRGCLDTTPTVHSDNAAILFWDEWAESDAIEYVTSDSISIKICTVSGEGQLETNLAPTDTVVMTSRAIRPYVPGNVKISGSYYPTVLTDVPLSMTWAHRDRKQQTATLVGFTEGNIGPEAGTTYSIRLYNNTTSVLLHSIDGLSAITSYSSFPSYTGTYSLRLEIWAVRSGYVSWNKYSHIFTLTNITRLTTEVGSTEHLLTEDGDFLTTE